MLFLPEFRIKKICDALFKHLVDNFNQCKAIDKENESLLYLMFHENSEDNTPSENYNEAKNFILRPETDPRHLMIFPIFNRERVGMPSIHVVVHQDNDDLKEIGDISGEIYNMENTTIDQLERGFTTQFNLITTSDNITEVTFINYILRALLLGSITQLQALGFLNPQFIVQDLNTKPEFFPINAYMKGIIMTASYVEKVPQIGLNYDKSINIIFEIDKIKY